VWARLGDLVRVLDFRGRTPKKLGLDWGGGDIPALSAVNVRSSGLDLGRTPHFGSAELYERWMTQGHAQRGDVLVTTEAPMGNVAQIPDDRRYILSQRVVLLKPDPVRVDHDLLAVQLRAPAFQQLLRDNKSGTTAEGIRQSRLVALRVALPPLPEQHRIVVKLESLQTRSRRAREALDAVPPLLEKLRQSILAAAFRGDLTKEWRAKNPDVEPASELLKRIRVERRKKWEEAELAKLSAKGKKPTGEAWKAKYKEPEPVDTAGLPELPVGWCWASLDELLVAMTSGSRAWSQYYGRGDGVFVMAQNVRPWTLDMAVTQAVDPPRHDAERLRTLVHRGDVLLTIVGAGTGDCCIVESSPREHYVCQSVALLRPVQAAVGWHLVAFMNAARGASGALTRLIYGQGRPHLSFDQLKLMAVPLPPARELRQLERETTERLAAVGRLEAGTPQLRGCLTTLDRSLLAKAFRGELVPQDPTDEPAAVTLARLREAAPAPAAKRKARRS
jgi:type I restriction enzyme, S subunit